MNRKTLLSVASALIAVGVMSVAGYGCGDDDDAVTKTDSGTPETSTTETGTGEGGAETGTKTPPVPTLGAQIDRMGRPAIATALISTFETDAGVQGKAKDSYNSDTAAAGWSAKYAPEMSGNLAIYDGLDTNCNNQFLASQDAGAQNSNIAKYGALGGVVADDRLWLNTAGDTCTTYLAVEGNATKIIPNNDCGGRGLKYDVIDVTYSVVAIGNVAGVGDDIAAVDAKVNGTTFPFLAAPVQ